MSLGFPMNSGNTVFEVFRLRSRAANLPQSVGPFVRVGRPVACGGKAPAMFQMRQEALPDSCRATAKAARHSALPLIRVAQLAIAVDAIERVPEFHQDHRILAS